MSSWSNIRISLLATIFGSVFFVLGRLILYPTIDDQSVTPFVFPTTVPLPKWQLVKSTPLTFQMAEDSEFHSGKYYRYLKNDLPLEIEMRYLVNTNGDIKRFITRYTGQLLPVLHEQEGIGYYSLFVHQGQAHLSSCINPRGASTVTADQFRHNGDIHNLRLDRILPWLISQKKIQDRRCLWVHLSVPLNDRSSENAYQTLETVWFSWYQWWSSHFPDS